MPKLDREAIVSEALTLLDNIGLDAMSTRQLAKRLGVEQPSLYWHFRSKNALFAAMAEAAMAPHATMPLPATPQDWREWFMENWRSFRQTLLMHRDGARLHAGTNPKGSDFARAVHKLEFLVASGLPEHEARVAMLTANHFTIGSVLEEQADTTEEDDDGPEMDYATTFDMGLAMIIDGLAQRTTRDMNPPS
ncbi:TetR/AcrR family transcriptional regulator C-terminal domain-containing protein [Amycolatopsis ultiminotia]|uniref:TetR/AcrR family transcriptional regulator C-terminal domain-containing protein n=1 Tax=Amycolatopsis ultiminotia TaxID=543629 RepID=A0ABP6YQV5_9PSEU